jgi:glycosyltransferase involved in cell wall biosynthesis
MRTQKPTAIVYGWPTKGTVTLQSDIYFEEGLFDEVLIYSLIYNGDVFGDYSKYKPDLIISLEEQINVTDPRLREISFVYPTQMPGNILANDIVVQSTFRNCSLSKPKFSIFTATYNTNNAKLDRLYESLKNQTIQDWEWVIVDDSSWEVTWAYLNRLAQKDYRIKPHRILPITNGNIGLAKNRAAMLCEGEWLLELDHDDALISNCLEVCESAAVIYKDAGFIYTDCCELFDDGEFKSYDSDRSGNWYGRQGNSYCWGYAGHTMVIADDKEYLAHHTADINPRTIRFNIGMPNHARLWRRDVYRKIGGHNIKFPVADDFELIIRTFLNTRMIHVKEMLYLQYSDKNTTTSNNSIDINRRARLVRDHYNERIHQRILDLGGNDWDWDAETKSTPRIQNSGFDKLKFGVEECYLNYVYEREK